MRCKKSNKSARRLPMKSLRLSKKKETKNLGMRIPRRCSKMSVGTCEVRYEHYV